jgi:hypothetical protein
MIKLITLIRRRVRVVNVVPVLWMFSVGCGLATNQKIAVNQFSESAVMLGDTTTTEVKAMRDTTVKMNIARLVLVGKDPKLADETSLDRGFDFKRVEVVTGATRALAAYGRTLLALVTDTQSSELHAASNEFLASLRRVPNIKSEINDQQLKAIGTVIQEVGGFWIERKRKRAVTTIVKESEQAVDRLCELLTEDFGTGKNGWVRLQLQVTTDPLLTATSSTLRDARTSSDRSVAANALHLLQDSRMRQDAVLALISSSAARMKTANKALIQAIENPEWSLQDIHDFAVTAHSLQTAVKTIVNSEGGK